MGFEWKICAVRRWRCTIPLEAYAPLSAVLRFMAGSASFGGAGKGRPSYIGLSKRRDRSVAATLPYYPTHVEEAAHLTRTFRTICLFAREYTEDPHTTCPYTDAMENSVLQVQVDKDSETFKANQGAKRGRGGRSGSAQGSRQNVATRTNRHSY